MLANIIRNAKKSSAVSGGDPYYSAVSLLLPMDGADGSTTFTDSSPNALTVTPTGDAKISTAQSKFGGASGLFDGTGDYLSFASGMPSGAGAAFTIECWIKLDDLSNYRAITRTVGGIDFGVTTTGQIICDQTGVGVIADSATGVISAGTWYHVAVTRDISNNYKVYVNGTQVASGTNAFSVTAATTIGYSAYSGAHYFKGYIDDFRVTKGVARYTSTFTPPSQAHPTYASSTPADPYYGQTSLLLHMDGANGSTSFVDSGPNALAVTASGSAATSTTQSKFGGASGSFNGTSSFLSASDSTLLEFGSGDFTVEAWIYPTSNSGMRTIFSKTSNGYSPLLFTINNGNLVYYLSSTGTTWNIASGVSGGSVTLNAWNHVAISRSGSTVRVFVNGVAGTSTTTSATLIDNTGPIRIGSNYFAGTVEYFSGYVDEFRITKYARYTAAFTPPSQAFPNA